jgi:UDPglucose 6-dehydrogenase
MGWGGETARSAGGMNETKAICVFGTGYVGVVTGAYLAHLDHRVTCLDVVSEIIDRPRFTTSHAESLDGGDCVYFAVNTPTLAGGSGADMQYVEWADCSIAEHLNEPAIINNTGRMPASSGDCRTGA